MPKQYCLCGCGGLVIRSKSHPEREKRYINGHNSKGKGIGWIINNGYRRRTFRGVDYFKYEHVLIMEKFLGRRLIKGEIVHHKNGDKLDNRLSNLELMTISQHMKEHYPNRKLNSLGQFI